MSKKPTIPDTVTVAIPFRVAKRGGHKEVQLPPGANNRSPCLYADQGGDASLSMAPNP